MINIYIYIIKMRILKSHPLLKLVNSYLIDSPQPSKYKLLMKFWFFISFLFNNTN